MISKYGFRDIKYRDISHDIGIIVLLIRGGRREGIVEQIEIVLFCRNEEEINDQAWVSIGIRSSWDEELNQPQCRKGGNEKRDQSFSLRHTTFYHYWAASLCTLVFIYFYYLR